MAIFSISFAIPPDWQDKPGDYEFTASMTAVVILNNVLMGDDGDILAAFDSGGNVRGLAIQLVNVPLGPYQGSTLYEMQIRSNSAGDLINFKYYDYSIDTIIIRCWRLSGPVLLTQGGPGAFSDSKRIHNLYSN